MSFRLRKESDMALVSKTNSIILAVQEMRFTETHALNDCAAFTARPHQYTSHCSEKGLNGTDVGGT